MTLNILNIASSELLRHPERIVSDIYLLIYKAYRISLIHQVLSMQDSLKRGSVT